MTNRVRDRSGVGSRLSRRRRPRDVLLRHLKGRIRSRSAFQPFTFNRNLVPVGDDEGETSSSIQLCKSRLSWTRPESISVLGRVTLLFRPAVQEQDVIFIRSQIKYVVCVGLGPAARQRSLVPNRRYDVHDVARLTVSLQCLCYPEAAEFLRHRANDRSVIRSNSRNLMSLLIKVRRHQNPFGSGKQKFTRPVVLPMSRCTVTTHRAPVPKGPAQQSKQQHRDTDAEYQLFVNYD